MFDYIFYKSLDFNELVSPGAKFARQNYTYARSTLFACWLTNYGTILMFYRDSELWPTIFKIGAFILFILPWFVYPKRRCEMIVKKFDAMPKEKLQNKKTAAIIYVIASIVVPIVILRATR